MGDRLSVTFLGKDLTAPLVLPAGVVGMSYSSLLRAIQSGAGMVTSKSFTLEPRDGHRGPVVSEFEGGIMNCMGLCNPGIREGIGELREFRKVCDAPLIVSVFANGADGFTELARFTNDSPADFLELNLSCPNVHGEFGVPLASSPEKVESIVASVKGVSRLPVIAKLSPNVPDIAAISAAAERGGADALCLINTVGPGMAIDIRARKPVLSNLFGGMSGPAVKPIAVRAVYEARRVSRLPIIGMGGVNCGEDAVELMMAGAAIVGVGTAVYYRGMEVFGSIREEINAFLEETGRESVGEIGRIEKVEDET